MTTTEQELSFIEEYRPYAESAAQIMRISPDIVLGQWALESDWGTAPYVPLTHNLAGIMQGSSVAAFTSVSQFVRAYVGSMVNDCPLLQIDADHAHATAQEIFAATRYNTVNPDYASEVAAIATQIAGMTAPAPHPVEEAHTVEEVHPAKEAHPVESDHSVVVSPEYTLLVGHTYVVDGNSIVKFMRRGADLLIEVV